MTDDALDACSAVSAGEPQTVGEFVYTVATDTWSWSDELYQIHGFAPGEVVPTTELMMAHKHPDDLPRSREVVVAALDRGEPFGDRHRILDSSGGERTVLALGEGVTDESGEVVELRGYFIDLTETLQQDATERARELFEVAEEQRTNIEQVKGALMVTYGLTDDEAFELLRWHSQHANVKIRDLANELVHQMSRPEIAVLPPRRKIAWIIGEITGRSIVIPPELASPITAMMGLQTGPDPGARTVTPTAEAGRTVPT